MRKRKLDYVDKWIAKQERQQVYANYIGCSIVIFLAVFALIMFLIS